MTKPQVKAFLAAKLYAAIRASENVNIGQLIKQADESSASEVRAAIKMLLDFGLVHRSTSKHDAVWADELPDSFEQAFEKLLARLGGEVELLREIVRLERRSALESQPTSEHEPDQAFTRISGRDARLRQLTVLYSAAQYSLDSLISEIPSAQTLRAALSDEQPLYQSSLKLRTIYPESAHTSKNALEYIETAKNLGVEFRSSISAPVRLAIVDEKVALVSPSTNDPDADAVVIRDPTIVRTLVDYFETLWRNGRPIPDSLADDDLDSIDRSIIEGLLAGHPKRTIAKSIGRTEKTVGRRIEALYESLGVKGEFALGVEARRHGWVD